MMIITLFNTTKVSVIGKMDFLRRSYLPKKGLPKQEIQTQIYQLQTLAVASSDYKDIRRCKEIRYYKNICQIWLAMCYLQRKTFT